jgi:hypothetical protein
MCNVRTVLCCMHARATAVQWLIALSTQNLCQYHNVVNSSSSCINSTECATSSRGAVVAALCSATAAVAAVAVVALALGASEAPQQAVLVLHRCTTMIL